MKKKILHNFLKFKLISSCFIIMAALLMVSSPSFSAQKLVVAHFEPEQAPWPQALKAWGAELEKVTNGKVKVTYAFGGSMGAPGEYHDLVKNGIVDVALAVLAFGGPGRFPMIDAAALPFYIPTAEVGAKAMFAYWKKGYMDKELSEVKPIAFVTGQGDTLYTRDKAVSNLSDMKGLKIFATSPLVAEKVKLWGGVPVAIPMTDLYMALEKKTIDGIILNYNVHAIFKLHEVLRYATLPATGSITSAFIMNTRAFDRLPPEGRAFVESEEIGRKYGVMFGKGWDGMCKIGQEMFFKSGGKELQWTPEAIKKREELENPLWERWVKDKEKRGLPGRAAVNDLYHIFEGLGIEPTAIGYTPSP